MNSVKYKLPYSDGSNIWYNTVYYIDNFILQD